MKIKIEKPDIFVLKGFIKFQFLYCSIFPMKLTGLLDLNFLKKLLKSILIGFDSIIVVFPPFFLINSDTFFIKLLQVASATIK